VSAQLLARDEGAARVLTISNPTRRGAVDAGLLARLEEEAVRAGRDRVRALILKGEGGAFSSGYDLSTLPEVPGGELPDAPLGRACAALEACAAPVIAAIEGPAFGAGFELTCACDFRLATKPARFSLPPAKLGLVYSPEGAFRVLRLVGLSNARELLLRARTLTAAEAEAMGLVRVVDDAMAEAHKLADELAELAPLSVAGMKRMLNELSRAPLDERVRAELDELRRAAFASEDAREGREAFLERRSPHWSGR
jgi:enoyl-CoA hydratase/carnithine racemase